jgi:lipopolysaccharide exporter
VGSEAIPGQGSPPLGDVPQPEVTRGEPLRHREGVTSGGAAKTLAWAAVSLMGSKLLAFVSTLILARLLVPEQFGVVAAGLTIIAVLETGLDLGVGAAVVYEQEQGLSDRMRTAFTLNVLVAVFFTVGAISAAPLVADFFGVPDDVDLLRSSSSTCWCGGCLRSPTPC